MADWLTGLALMWGVSNDMMLILIGFIVAFACSLVVMIELKRTKHESYTDAAIAVFFIVMFIECLTGLMNWMVFVILLLLFGAYEYTTMRGNG